jgi:hypothetical protein
MTAYIMPIADERPDAATIAKVSSAPDLSSDHGDYEAVLAYSSKKNEHKLP